MGCVVIVFCIVQSSKVAAMAIINDFLTYLLTYLLTVFCRLRCVVNRGADTLIEQAQGWESKGEYLRAIECYARVTTEVTSDANVLQRCWVKVSHLYNAFLCRLSSVCYISVILSLHFVANEAPR